MGIHLTHMETVPTPYIWVANRKAKVPKISPITFPPDNSTDITIDDKAHKRKGSTKEATANGPMAHKIEARTIRNLYS